MLTQKKPVASVKDRLEWSQSLSVSYELFKFHPIASTMERWLMSKPMRLF